MISWNERGPLAVTRTRISAACRREGPPAPARHLSHRTAWAPQWVVAELRQVRCLRVSLDSRGRRHQDTEVTARPGDPGPGGAGATSAPRVASSGAPQGGAFICHSPQHNGVGSEEIADLPWLPVWLPMLDKLSKR